MNKRTSLLITFFILLPACQPLPPTPSLSPNRITATATSQPVMTSTTTPHPPTQVPTITPTLIPVSAKSLAGLIISSPLLGAPYEVTSVSPATTITPNGLGIINSEGKLIKFSDMGLFEGVSPSGVRLVYQRGFEDEYTDRIDNLFVYNVMTGETAEIVDDLEHEGGKTILAWSPDEQKFFYVNNYLTVLFEAYGYFGTQQLLLADTTTGATKLLIRDGYQFDVSPDQGQIAYTTGELLEEKTKFYGDQALEKFGCFQPRMYDLTTGSSQLFDVSQLEETPICVGYPSWSPDGNKIAWIGYFANDTFRPIIFDLQENTGRIYDPLHQTPLATQLPANWYFGEPIGGGYAPDPDWVDNSTFWTPTFEVNVESGNTSAPREIDRPYHPTFDTYLPSPDGLLMLSLNEERDAILVHDQAGNLLSTFPLESLYEGPRQEILTSPFILPGRTEVVGWSPLPPPASLETP